MIIGDIIKELEQLLKETGSSQVTLKINHHYYDITDIYYDGYLDEIIIEHETRR